MKKQILFMMFLSLAFMFAGVNNVFGQAIDPHYVEADDLASLACPPPTELGDCAADGPLNPIPGKPYTYTVGVTPGVGSNTANPGYIQWFVYNATAHGGAIIDGGALTAHAEPNTGTSQFLLDAHKVGDVTDKDVYNNTTNTEVSIEVLWQSFNAVDNEILLVAYVMGEDGCADNIEVWRIEPTFAFTLDIAGLMPDGTLDYKGEDNAHECVSPVQEASYDGTNLNMDYGENYIFFVVNAANFVHSWQPTFTVSSTGTQVEIDDVTWAIPENAIDPGYTNWNPATTPVPARDASGAVGKDGECIIVRVYLDHGTTENDVATTVTLTVNGIMYDAAEEGEDKYENTVLADLDNDENVGDPCVQPGVNEATYDLTPRPNITEVTPGADTFVPKPKP